MYARILYVTYIYIYSTHMYMNLDMYICHMLRVFAELPSVHLKFLQGIQWIGSRENLNRKPSIFPWRSWGLNQSFFPKKKQSIDITVSEHVLGMGRWWWWWGITVRCDAGSFSFNRGMMLKDVERCWKMLNACKYANFDCFGDKQTWWHMVTLPRRLLAILLFYIQGEKIWEYYPAKAQGSTFQTLCQIQLMIAIKVRLTWALLLHWKPWDLDLLRDWVWHFFGRQSWVASEGPQPWSSWVSLGNSRRGLKIADSWHLITHADVSPQIWNLPSCMTSTTWYIWYNVIDLTWYNDITCSYMI